MRIRASFLGNRRRRLAKGARFSRRGNNEFAVRRLALELLEERRLLAGSAFDPVGTPALSTDGDAVDNVGHDVDVGSRQLTYTVLADDATGSDTEGLCVFTYYGLITVMVRPGTWGENGDDATISLKATVSTTADLEGFTASGQFYYFAAYSDGTGGSGTLLRNTIEGDSWDLSPKTSSPVSFDVEIGQGFDIQFDVHGFGLYIPAPDWDSKLAFDFSYEMNVVADAPPDIEITQVDWNTDRDPGHNYYWDNSQPWRGIDVKYKINHADLPRDAEIAFYWARENGDIIREVGERHPVERAQSEHEYEFNEMALWGEPPEDTQYILAVADPPDDTHEYGNIIESDESNNVRAIEVHSPTEILAASVVPSIGIVPNDRFDRIETKFEPGGGRFTMSEAEVALGVHHFNWYQRIIMVPEHWSLWLRPKGLQPQRLRKSDLISLGGPPPANPPWLDPVNDPRIDNCERVGYMTDRYQPALISWLGDAEIDHRDYYYNYWNNIKYIGGNKLDFDVRRNTNSHYLYYSDFPSVEEGFFDRERIFHGHRGEYEEFETVLTGVDQWGRMVSLPHNGEISFRWRSNQENRGRAYDYAYAYGGIFGIQPLANCPPMASAVVATIADDNPVAIGVPANDFDFDGTVDPTTLIVTEPPEHGTIAVDPDTGVVTYTPGVSFSGLDTFRYTVRDAEGALSNEATVTITDGELGPIDFRWLPDLTPSAGDLEYRFETTRPGILSIDASYPEWADVQLTFYDENHNELFSIGSGSGYLRIDHPTQAGSTYYVKLTGDSGRVNLSLVNLVQISPDGTEATVYGTDGVDTFEAVAGPPHVLLINGVQYDSPPFPSLNSIRFFGSGDDIAMLTGSDGDDVAVLHPDSGSLAGLGYQVELSGVSSITLEGGDGDDNAQLYDSPDDDEFVGWANASVGAMMITPKGTNTVGGFETIVGEANGGGYDTVKFYDSPGDDEFITVPSYGLLLGDGFSLQGIGFDEVNAYASAGGYDVTKMYDSPGDDTFYATPIETALFGDGFHNRAKFFEDLHAFATAGGQDIAYLHDSPDDDEFYATPVEGAIYSDTFRTRAKFFEEIHGDSSAGGSDTAYLHDTAGRDTFVATPTYAELSGPGFRSQATNFENVEGHATAGEYDVARLYDSPGDDVFWTTPTFGALSGDGFYNQAIGFEGVNTYATAGGYDTGKMYDSPGDDTFYATATEGMIWGPGFYHRAKEFERVESFATAGGSDVAQLFDSPGDDSFYGTPTEAALHGDGFFNRAKYFEKVYGDAGVGGHDEARLYDSEESDLLEADQDWARLSNAALDFLYQTTRFDYVKAISSSSGDKKDVPLLTLLQFDLELDGEWEDL